MEKQIQKGHPANKGKRWLALFICMCLIGTMIPVTARAENSSPDTGLCEHHKEHTTECGYEAPIEGHECEHEHTEDCYVPGEFQHQHTEDCYTDGVLPEEGEEKEADQCEHECTVESGCLVLNCPHENGEHDDTCGYVEASEGSPCTYECEICGNEAEPEENNLSDAVLDVQAMIDVLPDADEITEENFDEVSDMLGEIDTAREALTAEESELLDYAKYNAAVSKMEELMGQAGAGEAAVMSISGFDFSSTGNNGATVKTINLNAAALRPDSTWSTGGNLVYFGSYNSSPVAYRVLSSPNTQENSANYLLLDCNTILKTMVFSSDRSNIWTGSTCTVRNWLNGTEFYAGSVFSGIEKTAIAETALAGQSVYIAGDNGSYSYKDNSATNRVFCLSVAEADGLYADDAARIKTGGYAIWWLRSAFSSSGDLAGIVYSGGHIDYSNVARLNGGVSPALNVNLSSVLFASVSGQSASVEALDKTSALASVSDSTAKQWKLTLLDSSKKVNVTDGQSVERTDASGSTTITVPYTYADSNTTNPVSQISVMITDKAYTESDAQVLYYGALENTTITSGGTSATGTFTLPADLADQTCGTDYYAYIIAEDVNGSTETDYASTPFEITIPAASGSDPVTPDTPVAPGSGKGLGVSIIADPTAPEATTDAWSGSYVYFGTYSSNPVKYRVLDRTTTDFGSTTMLLDCDSILWAGTNSDNQSSRFDASSNVWAGSEIKTYLNEIFLRNHFTSLEQAAIAASSKANASTTDGIGCSSLNYAALSGEQIFLLDAKEATNTSYGYSNTDSSATNRKKTGGNAWWRLRSAYSYSGFTASMVGSDGVIFLSNVDTDYVGVSPALNVNLSSVIFSSVLSGTSGQPGAEYKLTLHDGNMTITPGTITRDSSDEVTVPYTIGGTNAGNAAQVSLMVLDKEYIAGNTNGAKLVAYEKLADASNTSGTFTLTDDMKNGSYYYYIVAEDVNAGNATDYASAPVQITIPAASAPNITTQSSNVTVREGETVTFTVAASGENLTYQWMINRNDGKGWVAIANANAASYTTSAVDKSCDGFQYKCVISNSAGTVESDVITLTAQDAGSSNPGGGGSDNPGSGGGSDNPGDSGSDNPDTPSNPDTTYQIIGGANSSWTAGSSEGLTIRGNGEFSKFTGVKVDGKLLDQSNYTAKEGSTIITLEASYLNTLAAGTHTFEILWTDGSASTTFTINANTSDNGGNNQNNNDSNNNNSNNNNSNNNNSNNKNSNPDDSALLSDTAKKDDVPKTGDNTPVVWLFILSIVSGTGLILTGKKGKKNLETLRK